MGNISRKNGTNCDRHAKHVGASERDPIFAKFGRDDPPVKESIDLLSRMKLPAPRGGVSEEGELSVLMELLINPSLLLDVVPYCGLIPMLTYCAGKIPIGPKLSTPQLFLDIWIQAKYLPRCDTFYYRYQLRDAVRRNRLHQKMDVVLIRAYLQKFYLVTLLYLETNIPQHLIHSSIKHHPSIFRRKHHMIQ